MTEATTNPSRSSRLIRLLVVGCLSLVSTACGFHLRDDISLRLPSELSPLRLTVAGGLHDPLAQLMRRGLESQGGVTLTQDAAAPLLELRVERQRQNVLSVDAQGRANGYTLRYELGFRVLGPDGRVWLAPQQVQLVRDYSVRIQDVLAAERQQDEMLELMRCEAVQQVLRRLASFAAPAASK